MKTFKLIFGISLIIFTVFLGLNDMVSDYQTKARYEKESETSRINISVIQSRIDLIDAQRRLLIEKRK